jgi:putative salt-induced outer membrane protein YdiY
MPDPTSIIQSVGIIFTIGLSVFAIIRSSKIQQNKDTRQDNRLQTVAILDVQEKLTKHILEDAHVQTQLSADVGNIQNTLDSKLETIIEKLK